MIEALDEIFGLLLQTETGLIIVFEVGVEEASIEALDEIFGLLLQTETGLEVNGLVEFVFGVAVE